MNEILGTINLIIAIVNFSYLFRTGEETNKHDQKQISFIIGCIALAFSFVLFLHWGIFK